MKNNKVLLIFSILFFVVASAFSYYNSSEMDPYDCNVCDAIDNCVLATAGQVGKTKCDGDRGCELSGHFCWSETDPGESDN